MSDYGYTSKSVEPTEDVLERIGRFTRRPFTADEVYLFSVTLCDNEIDRDGERFSVDALHKLAELFIGRTGIFDHEAKTSGQTARIFETAVCTDEARKTAAGEPYTYLSATAYMVRTGSNADLIREIDGGIKKEVSVSCSVARQSCSVCGADPRAKACGHKRGKLYGGVPAHIVLDGPTDAYEWSFVAVPAQRGAGVTKGHGDAGAYDSDVAARIKAAGKGLSLSASEVRSLRERLEALEAGATLAESCRAELEREVVRLGFLACPAVPAGLMAQTAKTLGTDELLKLKAAYRDTLSGAGGFSQLTQGRPDKAGDNEQFKL